MKLLQNCRVIPSLTEGYDGNMADIRIDGDRIEGIYTCGSVTADEYFDVEGMTVLPGLFDLHMHVNFDSTNVHYIASRSTEQAIIDGIDYAQDYLRNGYTFIRDCGIVDHSGKYIRQIFDRGIAMGPHYVFAGACNTPTASGNDTFGQVYKVVDGAQNALAVVREDLAHGASFVKYMVTGAMMNEGGDPQAMLCTYEELKAMADAANYHGSYLSCHTHGKPGILACIQAGVYTVEHCTYMDDECIEAFKAANGRSVCIPTLGIVLGIIRDDSGVTPEFMRERSREIFDMAVKNLGRAYREGVIMGWGSDADRATFDKYPGIEFEARKSMGLSNIELLRMATIDSAKIMHVEDRAGTVKAGKWADFCIVDGNPDENIDVMRKLPAHVFIGGKLFV